LLRANALGSVTVSRTTAFTVFSFALGLNNAALPLMSQQKGLGSDAGWNKSSNAFVDLLTLMALTLGISGSIFAAPLLRLLGTPEGMMAGATAYLQINFLGILFLLGYNFIGTVLRSLGDSRTPMRFVLLAVALNIVLDPLFIAG